MSEMLAPHRTPAEKIIVPALATMWLVTPDQSLLGTPPPEHPTLANQPVELKWVEFRDGAQLRDLTIGKFTARISMGYRAGILDGSAISVTTEEKDQQRPLTPGENDTVLDTIFYIGRHGTGIALVSNTANHWWIEVKKDYDAMIEARILTPSLATAEQILITEHATFQGDYEMQDNIYSSVDASKTLLDEFLRLRVMPKNIWDSKPVVLAIKQTNLQPVGKQSVIPLHVEFDTKEQANAYIQEHLQQQYAFDFAFSRTGRQYFMPNGDVVDLEVVEGYPSIEFKSETQAGITKLLGKFSVTDETVITGPSVVAVKKLLKNS